MARETITRGRSALPEQADPGARITRLRPTLRGICAVAVALVLLAVAAGTRDATLFLLLVVAGLPLVIAPVIVLAQARRAAGVELHMMATPPLVPLGIHCSLLLQLSHSGDGALPPLRLDRPSDHWSARVSGAGPAARPMQRCAALATDVGRQILWDRIGSDTSSSSTLTLPTGRRGVFMVGPLRLWVYDPFGLFAMPVAVARPVTIVVHPAALGPTALRAVRPGSSGSTQSGDGPATAHTDDPGGEWSGLRSYERGDRLHLLSWQAEARFDTLLVHDFRPDSDHAITIVFDDRAGVHRRHAFEQALGAVLGLACAAELRDRDYDVSTLSGRRVRGANTPDGLVALLTFLAETQPIRSKGNAGASTPSIPTGALVVTTPTAVATLTPSIEHDSLVVIE